MKYFYDTEFLEGTQKKWFKQSEPTIDLISIGIVAEDGREYYAISKDFNLKEAWNRYDEVLNRHFPLGPEYNKVYWIRENVLKPIYYDLIGKDINFHEVEHFTYKNFKRLLKLKGKSNKQIAKEIIDFVNPDLMFPVFSYNNSELKEGGRLYEHFEKHNVDSDGKYCFAKPEFYGYYSAYDHVALCWLFGKMIDLPKGFPMYTIDLKQSFDEKQEEWINKTERQRTKIALKNKDFSVEIDLKKSSNYPKQDNEHNALDDAKWIKELYKFLETIN